MDEPQLFQEVSHRDVVFVGIDSNDACFRESERENELENMMDNAIAGKRMNGQIRTLEMPLT